MQSNAVLTRTHRELMAEVPTTLRFTVKDGGGKRRGWKTTRHLSARRVKARRTR